MSNQQFVQSYDALFAGRRDVYGEGYPDSTNPEKYRYRRVEEPVTPRLLTRHLQGEICIGVYPIQLDNTVTWFALDLDADKELPADEAYAQALVAAKEQQRKLTAAGLTTYLERSRSGKGVHVWGFLDGPVQAAEVRRALRPHLVDDITFDRMYPVQDELTPKKPWGNLIALPFHGQALRNGYSTFLDDADQPVSPREFLASVYRNAAAVIEFLVKKAPRERAPRPGAAAGEGGTRIVRTDAGEPTLTGALKVISPYGCKFMRHCWTNRAKLEEPLWHAALQVASHFRHGRDFAHLISYDYAPRGAPAYDADVVDAKYDQVLANDKIGCNWIHENYPALACNNCPNRNGQRLAPHFVAQRSVIELADRGEGGLQHVGSFAQDLDRVKRYQTGELQSGVRWPIPGLDEVMRMRPGEMVVVGGMQSMGKTHLFIDTVRALAEQGIYVGAFSAETGAESFRQRLLANMAQVNSLKLRGEHWEAMTRAELRRLEEAGERLSGLPIYTDFTTLAPEGMLRQWEEAVLTNRIPMNATAVLVFDYLQFSLRQAGENEYEHISRSTGEFKYVAKILEKTVVPLSQLKREHEGGDKPAINWFKGTGRIESDMDGGLIITGERIDGDRAPRTITIVKQREGKANVAVDFILDQTTGRWERPASQQRPEERPDLLGGFGVIDE